jgi:hypothetical protein
MGMEEEGKGRRWLNVKGKNVLEGQISAKDMAINESGWRVGDAVNGFVIGPALAVKEMGTGHTQPPPQGLLHPS